MFCAVGPLADVPRYFKHSQTRVCAGLVETHATMDSVCRLITVNGLRLLGVELLFVWMFLSIC